MVLEFREFTHFFGGQYFFVPKFGILTANWMAMAGIMVIPTRKWKSVAGETTLMLSVSLQFFYELADAVHLGRDADTLRTMFLADAAAALDAMVGLAIALNGAVEADEVFATLATILGAALVAGQTALGLHLVVVGEDGGDVDAVGAGHTVLAGVAGDELLLHHLVGNLRV